MEDKQADTGIYVMLSILIAGFLWFKEHQSNLGIATEQSHRIEQCNFVVQHAYHRPGIWNERYGMCMIHLRFYSDPKAPEAYYEADFPVDQIPPSI